MTDLIRVEALHKRFGRVRALEEVSLGIPEGATYFLLGPNGSGKTTLVRLLTGVLRPTEGTVTVLDVDPYRKPHRLVRRLGIAYEDHHLPPWATARDYLRFAARASALDDATVGDVAEAFELSEYWERQVGTYSAGMQKRVMLAQAWLGDPELLLLDEPFSNLDPEGRRLLADLLGSRRSDGRTTLVATHLAETVAPPTHLACFLNGRVAADARVEELADQLGARTIAVKTPDPIEAARVLLKMGIGAVTAREDTVVVQGDSATVEAAVEALRDAGLEGEVLEESYDIWSLYRSILSSQKAAG
ncbi:MAG: ABC transporter ATP-binding protein [Thermoplasmata archaeon]